MVGNCVAGRLVHVLHVCLCVRVCECVSIRRGVRVCVIHEKHAQAGDMHVCMCILLCIRGRSTYLSRVGSL